MVTANTYAATNHKFHKCRLHNIALALHQRTTWPAVPYRASICARETVSLSRKASGESKGLRHGSRTVILLTAVANDV
jgi:hypothetical protein